MKNGCGSSLPENRITFRDRTIGAYVFAGIVAIILLFVCPIVLVIVRPGVAWLAWFEALYFALAMLLVGLASKVKPLVVNIDMVAHTITIASRRASFGFGEQRQYNFEEIVSGRGDIEHPESAYLVVKFSDGKSLRVHERNGMRTLKQVCIALNVWQS